MTVAVVRTMQTHGHSCGAAKSRRAYIVLIISRSRAHDEHGGAIDASGRGRGRHLSCVVLTSREAFPDQAPPRAPAMPL